MRSILRAMTDYVDGQNALEPSFDSASLNGYARLDGPSTVDELLRAPRAGHAIALPGAGAGQAGAGYRRGVGANLGGPVSRVGVR